MHQSVIRRAVLALPLTLLICHPGGAQEPPAVPPSAAPVQQQAQSDTLTVPGGEHLLLELQSALHTRNSKKGDRVHFRVSEPLRVGNEIALPRDSEILATVTKVKRPGRLFGRAEIQLRFDEIVLSDGTRMPFQASILRAGFTKAESVEQGEAKIEGEGGNSGTLAVIAQGGIQGATIGVMSRSAKGIGYGAAAGAAIGLASVVFKRGPELDLPRSTLFEAQTTTPIQVPVASVAVAAAGPDPRPAVTRELGELQNRPQDEVPVPPSAPRPVLRRPEARTDRSPEVSTPAPETAPSSAPARPGADAGSEGAPAGTARFKLSVEVPLVIVEAVVRDRAGRPIDNLKQDDFHAFENGVEQPIQNFSRDQLPLAIAIVVDRSGSVAPFMPALRESAYRALSGLKPDDTVALFSFASEVQRMEDLTSDRRRIADRIADIRPGGGTNIIDALFDAVHYLGMVAPNRRHAVILISDNEATVRPKAGESSTIRLALETEAVVYSLKTPGESLPVTVRLPNLLGGAGSVSKVTCETGGEIIDVSTTGGIGTALDLALTRLRLRYTIGYYPSEPFNDDSFRSITVRLDDSFGNAGSDYTVYARRGYYPPKPAAARP